MNYEMWNDAILETIAGGEGIELLNHEIKKAIGNCFDSNTVIKAKRKVILEIEMIPNDERTKIITNITAKSVLAPDQPLTDIISLSEVGTGHVAKGEQLSIQSLSISQINQH